MRAATARTLAAVLLLGVACGPVPSPFVRGSVATKAGADTLTVWVGPSPTLHPHGANPQVTAALFSPMVVIDPDTRLPVWGPEVPTAFVDAIATDDLRRWQLTVKDGWTWHDGTPVTAEDVARGWMAAIEADLPVTSTLSDIRVRDKRTLSFSLAAPYGQLPVLLAGPAFLPLPPHHDADPEGFAVAPVGNGPFELTNRSTRLLELRAFANAPGGHPPRDLLRVSLDPAPDDAMPVAVAPDGVGTPGSAVRTETVVGPGLQLAYLGFPLADARYADTDTRRALSLALDRDQLVRDVAPAGAVPADRLVGPGLARAAGVVCGACVHDPDGARDLWPGDPEGPLTLWFAADAGHEDLVNAIAGQWREVLAVQNIQLASLPAEDLFARLAEQQVSGPFRLSWNADLPSPSRLLHPLFADGGGANDFGFSSSGVNDALDVADLTEDLVAATDAYGRVEQLVLDELPLIPLWFSVVTVTAAPGVDVSLDGRGALDWANLSSP